MPQIFGAFFPWIRQLLFGSVIKKAGRGALLKSPLRFNTPNILVTGAVICGVNTMNFLVMYFMRDHVIPAIVTVGIVSMLTTYFALRGFRSKHAKKERIALFSILMAFFGVFMFCVLVIDLWWIALAAKLTLEVLLCYSIMLTNKQTADAAQSKAVSFVSEKLKIPPDSRLAKLLSYFDP